MNEAVFSDGEANGEGIDGGGYALDQQCYQAYLFCAFAAVFRILGALAALNALDEHLAADEAQKSKSDPGDKLFEAAEELCYRVYAYPTDKWHEELECGEYSCHTAHFCRLHVMIVKTVCKRDGECIHCKSYSQHYAGDKKTDTPGHFFVLLGF